MKQIFQDLKSGSITLSDLPFPSPAAHEVVIQTHVSIVSPGTERMLASFALANPIQKALQQPERVRQVFQKMRTDGIRATLSAIDGKLSTPIPVGYSNAGTVRAVGSEVTQFRVGDRVASNGPHAEVVCVPSTLCARIPESVSFETAAFTPLAAIALQGIRLSAPTLGEIFAVQGLGVLGLLAAQILKANGCRVLAFDVNPSRVAIAKSLGIEAHELSNTTTCTDISQTLTNGRGVDGVLIAASSKSDSIVHQAASMCRRHGRIVLLGAVGLDLDRRDFYEKELSFQVSCSYGPGRYEPQYEGHGLDFPPGYVRWTAQRNFEAVLALFANGAIAAAPLVSNRVDFSNAATSYQSLLMSEESLGIAFAYEAAALEADRSLSIAKPQAITLPHGTVRNASLPRIGVIGAGQFSSGVLCPALKKLPVTMTTLCSSRGAEASALAKKFSFEMLSSDPEALLQSDRIDTAFITTRHDSHARLACLALRAGKDVFVEKPLALSPRELSEVMACARKSPSTRLMVGFNRRFSPLTQKAQELLAESTEPKAITIAINPGYLDPKHWIHDRSIGGGRLIGEGCHFVDLAICLAGSFATSAYASSTRGGKHEGLNDVVSVQLQFQNGSIGTIHYYANGSKDLPKERVEVFCGGKVVVIDNFRELKGFGFKPAARDCLRQQDKGHHQELARFIDAIRTGAPSPISLDELENSARATLAAQQSLITGQSVALTALLDSDLEAFDVSQSVHLADPK